MKSAMSATKRKLELIGGYLDLHPQRLDHSMSSSLHEDGGWRLRTHSLKCLPAVNEFHRVFDALLYNNTRPLIRAALTRLPSAFYFCKCSPCE